MTEVVPVRPCFNLALLPLDKRLEMFCVQYAQRNHQVLAKDYLLSIAAFPHVTLSHFHADTPALPALWKAVAEELGAARMTLQFDGIYYKARSDGDAMVSFIVERSDAVLALQDKVCDLLAAQGFDPSTARGNGYCPHLTMAKLRGRRQMPRFDWPDSLWAKTHEFALSLGESDENGVYQRRIYPVNFNPTESQPS